jgi:tetratricopeptide (TPR) repeat protein
MFRKNYLTGFLTIALFLIGGTAVFAQTTAAVRGKVELVKADGTKEPVAGALVEVYRIDVKAKFPSDTTDKKGGFSFAGLPVGANFVLAVSGPNIKGLIQGGIKAGMENVLVPVEPGDGKRYSEEEVRAALSSSSTTQSKELTAEEKKKQAELEKQRADITAKNEKILSQTATVKKALDEGTAAYESKNYDVAVVKFEEGYQANPDYVGSAPVLLNAKAQALRLRAVTVFNAEGSNKDVNLKIAALAKVQKDLGDALEAYSKSWAIIKAAPATEINDPKTNEINKQNVLTGAKETLRIMSITRQVDTTKTDIAKSLMGEYLAIESDQAKKTEAQRILGDIYLSAGDSDNAIIEYKKVLDINPTDPDSLVGIGLSLITSGYSTNDKTKMQEGADYLQRFIDVAPANHKFLQDAKDSIAQLKADQNVAPQKGKTPTPKKKTN